MPHFKSNIHNKQYLLWQNLCHTSWILRKITNLASLHLVKWLETEQLQIIVAKLLTRVFWRQGRMNVGKTMHLIRIFDLLKCPTLISIYFIFKVLSTFFLLIRPPIVGIIILNRLAKFSLAIYSIIFSSEFGQGVHT